MKILFLYTYFRLNTDEAYNEDAGYGLVLWIDIADKIGIEIPTIRAMLQIVSAIMGRDYKAEKARTMDSLGLGDYSIEELCSII